MTIEEADGTNGRSPVISSVVQRCPGVGRWDISAGQVLLTASRMSPLILPATTMV